MAKKTQINNHVPFRKKKGSLEGRVNGKRSKRGVALGERRAKTGTACRGKSFWGKMGKRHLKQNWTRRGLVGGPEEKGDAGANQGRT